MRLRYTVPAAADLDGILAYVARHSPQGSARVAERLRATELLIEAFPHSGAQTRLPWLRRMMVTPYPYAIFYEVTERDIVVHAVRHAARKSFMP